MRIDVQVDAKAVIEELEEMPDKLGRSIAKWLAQGSQVVVAAVQEAIDETTTRRTGTLIGSVKATVGRDSATVEPTAEYAAYVDQGTRPHVIEPRDKEALAFPMAGGVRATRGGVGRTRFTFGGKTVLTGLVFATRVHHPGFKGAFFMEAAAGRVVKPVTDLLEDIVEDELRGNPS